MDWCIESGIGLKLVSMRRRSNASNQLITAAYVSAIVPGSAADRLHGELSEGITEQHTMSVSLSPCIFVQHITITPFPLMR